VAKHVALNNVAICWGWPTHPILHSDIAIWLEQHSAQHCLPQVSKSYWKFIKALANEETLLRTRSWCFLGCANWETFLADKKCFWTKSETFFVSRTQNLCPQQMLRVRGNGETFVSATMCPRLPGPLLTDQLVARDIFTLSGERVLKRNKTSYFRSKLGSRVRRQKSQTSAVFFFSESVTELTRPDKKRQESHCRNRSFWWN